MNNQTDDAFAAEVEAADSVASKRIAELEAENATLKNSFADRVRVIEMQLADKEKLEQEVARLTAHIRAIAEHHDKQINFVESSDDIDYQTMRRDFALSGLEKP